ncbi:MAG: response regulator [Myxococcales bacterium]|nr:response regulator [Myxococcales bacterium]
MKVLVVDDEPLITKMLARFARMRGHEATVASDGQEAWELFSSDPEQWAVMITDILMPRMNGVELVERIRSSGSDIPVVFISAHGQVPDVEALSPATFLPKPFRRAELLEALEASAPRRGP